MTYKTAEKKNTLSVREAKACFSEVIRKASSGQDFTVTVHGRPAARISGGGKRTSVFKVNWKWLEGMKPKHLPESATSIIRNDRDARG